MAWLSLLLSAITVLAVCRLTRLVTTDALAQPLRDWAFTRTAPRPDGRPAVRGWRYLAKLLTCDWCAGFWISAAAVLAFFRMWLGAWPHDAPTFYAYGAATFATSYLCGALNERT